MFALSFGISLFTCSVLNIGRTWAAEHYGISAEYLYFKWYLHFLALTSGGQILIISLAGGGVTKLTATLNSPALTLAPYINFKLFGGDPTSGACVSCFYTYLKIPNLRIDLRYGFSLFLSVRLEFMFALIPKCF